MSDEFADLGMGVGVRIAGTDSGAKMPEQMDHGVGAVYDRVRRAGGTMSRPKKKSAKMFTASGIAGTSRAIR
jgi:hypothetical protein